MALTWNDLIIEDITLEQFQQWIQPWIGVIGGRVAPAFLSKFGTWFLRRPEGHVEMLDVFTGTVQRMADRYDDFVAEVNQQWWQEVYLLSELLRLHDADKIPGSGQCYALAPHPAVGGPNPVNGDAVDPRFVVVMDVIVWQKLCSLRWCWGEPGQTGTSRRDSDSRKAVTRTGARGAKNGLGDEVGSHAASNSSCMIRRCASIASFGPKSESSTSPDTG
jgi:hypothetical protein